MSAIIDSHSRPNQRTLLAYLALGVAIISLGFSAIFVRLADAPGAVTSFYRMAVAVVVLTWPFFRRLRSNGMMISKRGWQIAFLGGLFFAADLALWATGVVLSGATNPTLLANMAPIWVGLGALLFFQEKLSLRFWSGLALTIAGAVVILGLDSLRAISFVLGSLLGLLAGIFYAAYFLVTQQGRKRLDSLAYFWPAALSSTVVLLALSLLLRLPLIGYSTTTYVNFLLYGLVTQVIGYLAISFALGYLPASLVSPTLLGQPVLTALLAWPLLGEVLSRGQVFGGVAVLAGVYAVHLSKRIPPS